MKRKLFIAVSVIAAALLLATPVFGITFGELDGERHPNVGALLVAWPYPDGPIDIVCSGTLISPTVFLTAAHCVNWMPEAGIPEDAVYVTFDSVYEIGSPNIYPGTYHINPNYGMMPQIPMMWLWWYWTNPSQTSHPPACPPLACWMK